MAGTSSGVPRERGAGGRLGRMLAGLPRPSRRRSDAAPRVAFTKEDARRLNERFALLDRAERRAIVRAVNRGVAMGRRRDAELAVGVARRQQRFWSRAWLLGPVIAFFQVLVTPIGWVEGLLLGAWGAVLLGMMAAWWWTRARRAELANLQAIGGRAGRGPTGGSGGSTAARTARSRLPGGPPRPVRDDDAPVDGPEGHGPEADEPGASPRPPRPRGRKRR